MTDDTYNGWVNRETWACALHLSNDYVLYNTCVEILRTQSNPADAIKDWVEEAVERVYFEPAEAQKWARMLAADVGSLWRVDWDDVAESFREEGQS